MKICFVVTDSQNLHSLYRGQFLYLKNKDYDITAIASSGVEHTWLNKDGIKTKQIYMSRGMSPFNDLFSLIKLFKYFVTNRFDVIVVSTPKASLLGMLAARLSMHRRVIYQIRGRIYENMTGSAKFFYKSIDKLVCYLSIRNISISRELLQCYINEGISAKGKISVLGQGSSNGVDSELFSPFLYAKSELEDLRRKIDIPLDNFVFFYCGRIRKEKGISELIEAFLNIQGKASDNVSLLIVGEVDKIDQSGTDTVLQEISDNSDIYLLPWRRSVEKYFAIADVFVFPSYREGFGNVALEASSMQLPVVAFDVIGVREAVINNETGILCLPFCTTQMTAAMYELYQNHSKQNYLGHHGRKRVLKYFQQETVWANLDDYFRKVANL